MLNDLNIDRWLGLLEDRWAAREMTDDPDVDLHDEHGRLPGDPDYGYSLDDDDRDGEDR